MLRKRSGLILKPLSMLSQHTARPWQEIKRPSPKLRQLSMLFILCPDILISPAAAAAAPGHAAGQGKRRRRHHWAGAWPPRP